MERGFRIICILLFGLLHIVLCANHGHSGGRNGGHGYGNSGGHKNHWGDQNRYNYANSDANNYQQPNYLQPSYDYNERIKFEVRGCPQPQFKDSAQLEIEGCKSNLRQDQTSYCHNKNLMIPVGKSVVVSCIRGRRLLRLTSRCEEDGCWKPEVVSNCDELFALVAEVKGSTNPEPETEYKKPLDRHCAQIKMDQFPNFLVKCHFPKGFQETVGGENCMSEFSDGVPSGTRIEVTCRPPATPHPSQGPTPTPDELTCQDGNWEGKIRKIVCNVPVPPTVPKLPSAEIPSEKPVSPSSGGVLPKPSTSTPVVNKPVTTQSEPINTCAPLKGGSGVELSCAWSGPTVGTNNCETRMIVGTEARYTCAKYYETTSALPTIYRKCKADGTWSGSSDFSCVVACGRDNAVKVAFITHSQPTLQGQWPWHAALFRNRSSDRESWEYICGATLITKKALLTAGHCVTLLQTTQLVDTADIQVHLGKYRREVNDEHVQIKHIRSIIVNPNYNPYNYDSDLALIILKTDVTIGHFVRPICFLTTSDSGLEDLQLSDNSIGTVVGWGYDENNKLADDLRMAKLRVVGTRECAKSMMGSSITQLNARSTTFCAGYANGTNVCNGDSGSGMYFPTQDTDNTRWYIQGLVSVGIAHSNGQCNPEAFSVFTRLGRYADFITRTLSENDAL